MVRISSLRGTLRIHIKPPPSDQLWFGFTSMPDIDFNLDSAVGDHKITNGQIALFIINRLKVQSGALSPYLFAGLKVFFILQFSMIAVSKKISGSIRYRRKKMNFIITLLFIFIFI